MTTTPHIYRAHAGRLLLALHLVGLCAGHDAQSAAQAADGEHEEFDFQSFVNDPPVIQTLVFSSEKPPLATAATNRQPTRFFHVRWQSPVRFVMRTASSLDELVETSSGASLVEWYCAGETRWWHLIRNPTNEFLVRFWDTTTPSDKQRNPVLTTVNTARHVNLDHVLKLGLWYLPKSGVVWEGDQFAFTNSIEETVGRGQLVRDQSGRVSSLLYTFSRPIQINGKRETRTWRHRNDYAYDGDADVPRGFPSQLDNYVLREDAPPFHNERIRFHKVNFSRIPLAESELDFEILARGYPLVRWMTTNDTECVFDGKQWTPVPDPSLFDRTHRVPRWARIFVVAVLLAPTVLLAVWTRRNKNAA